MAKKKKLYVGNLSSDTTAADLTELFSQHGDVQSAALVTDRESGRSRGFAFVEMAQGADAAVAKLDGQPFKGRNLTVNEAQPRKEGARGGRSAGPGDRRAGSSGRRRTH